MIKSLNLPETTKNKEKVVIQRENNIPERIKIRKISRKLNRGYNSALHGHKFFRRVFN
jgi:hypothetical protein